ncbi:hypothetical protein [Fodinicola feengrottensis]|uniref:hypothetical protein n=1 Tax=Fodinicola feengrottensis TaxID=435914 RepID=UPI0013D1A613|nr:hypothetical protein [Fodinicola feengrottensis]
MLGLRSKGHGERIVVADWLELRKDGNRFTVVIRPGVYGPEHRSTLAAITALLDDAMPDVGLLDVLAQQEIDTICAQTAAGEYLQNPAVAVPDLVATAAARHAIDSGAATLYLQLLALPDPTDANVARWTGWPADRLKAARAALAETDLVRTAKRTRAGRSLFFFPAAGPMCAGRDGRWRPGSWHCWRRIGRVRCCRPARWPAVFGRPGSARRGRRRADVQATLKDTEDAGA